MVPANWAPIALRPSETTMATASPASAPRSLTVAMKRLSAVALPVSNSLPHNARMALRRLPIQPIPEYRAISRPTMPTPSGLATTLSISAMIGSAMPAGSRLLT